MNSRTPDRTTDTGLAPSPDTLSALAAAARIGVSERTIRRAIGRGELAAAKCAGAFQIALPDLDQYQSARFHPPGPGAPHGRAAGNQRPPLREPARRQAPAISALPSRVRLLPLTDQHPDPVAGLPRPLTSLIGRERETAEVRALLGRDDTRLVTLTGPGGIGKSRLAINVAAAARTEFADGAAFVPLFAVSDPALAVSAIAHALAVRRAGGGKLLECLKAALRTRQLLLVLDNFEHLLPAAPALAELLAAASDLKLLVTSRARLRLSGEYDYPVAPLALPDRALGPDFTDLAASPAVRLFLARARAVQPDFALRNDNLPAVAAICERLDGVPLAIELAAARCGLLSPAAILARLDRRLSLLTSGARDQPARLRSMRDAIAWSHDLLPPGEQLLFRRLAVFVRGCTFEAAAAMAGDDELDVFDGLASLVEKSLLWSRVNAGDAPRFGMLETIREYGLERLEASGEAERVRRRHAEICLALVEELAPILKGAGTVRGLDRLAAELPNLRAAVTWALARAETVLALRLVAAIYPSFWFSRGDPHEGRQWLEAGLGQAGDVPVRIRVDALDIAAMLTAVQGDYPRALALAGESQALAQGDGYAFGVARAEFCFAMIAEWQGDFEQAAAGYAAALAHLRELDDPYWIAMSLTNLAVSRHRQGMLDQAARLADEGLVRWRDVGNPWGIAMSLTAAAAVAADRHEWAPAGALHREALGHWVDLDDKRGIAGALAGLASEAAHQGQPEQGARLLGAASALIGTIGVAHPLHPAEYERATAVTRIALGETAFLAAWEAGRRESIADAVAAAVAFAATGGATRSTPAALPFSLTTRELEVVRLLGRRATNKEIAAALFISVRTAGRHVDSILHKLGLDSRREVAALLVTHDLT